MATVRKTCDNVEKLKIASFALQEEGPTGKTSFNQSSNGWKDDIIP